VFIVVLLVILAFRSGRQWCRYLPQTSVSPLRRTHRLCVELDSARYANQRILENAVENSSQITNSVLKWSNICAERERECFSCAVRLSFVSLSLSEVTFKLLCVEDDGENTKKRNECGLADGFLRLT